MMNFCQQGIEPCAAVVRIPVKSIYHRVEGKPVSTCYHHLVVLLSKMAGAAALIAEGGDPLMPQVVFSLQRVMICVRGRPRPLVTSQGHVREVRGTRDGQVSCGVE